MALTLTEVTSVDDYEEVMRCLFDAFDDPQIKLRQVTYPVFGTSLEARDAAIREAAQRQVAVHGSKGNTWIKVTDDSSNKIVGAARWCLFEANPYANPPKVDCVWWPEGEDRAIANELITQLLVPRVAYMSKPHAFLHACFTHPDYRRRGIADQVMKWGVERADAKGLETYIDATEGGLELYRKWGFIDGAPRDMSLTNKGLAATDRRRELEQQMLPQRWWPMYRPLGGRMDTGDASLPWAKDCS